MTFQQAGMRIRGIAGRFAKGRAGWVSLICAVSLAISGLAVMGRSVANAVETVHFESTVTNGSGLRLTGYLKKPEGAGPFPALVLLHGCGGRRVWNELWSKRFVGWGYVVLEVDSFGPRNRGSVCGRPWKINDHDRALDAFGAKKFLTELAYVDPRRIGLVGVSHGGWSVLQAVRRDMVLQVRQQPFAAAVAFYPWCGRPGRLASALLILIGDLDDWTPADRCRSYFKALGGSEPVQLKVYEGAYHGFDIVGLDISYLGHVLRHNPNAERDARTRVRVYLDNHLRR